MDHREPVGQATPDQNRQSATILADVAIFTSIRTPMGEGYRIVASTPGLKPKEKQSITQHSPSHGALCATADTNVPAEGVGFYALPSGRLCVAHSQPAGAEHTGRGGQRIYTVNVVVAPEDMAAFGFNPFAIVRALKATDLITPQLKPPPRLEPLSLTTPTTPHDCGEARFHPAMDVGARTDALAGLLIDRNLIFDVASEWIASAEALLLGLPGPLRIGVSCAAGLTFSVGRKHRVQFLHDATPTTETRVSGQPIEYRRLGQAASSSVKAAPIDSPWLAFVELHWSRGDFTGLAARTSLAFADTSPMGRDRVGRMYLAIDALPEATTPEILAIASDYLPVSSDTVEQPIVDRILHDAGHLLARRFGAEPWTDLVNLWYTVGAVWRSQPRGTAFAQPLIELILQRLASSDPLACLEAALSVSRDVPAQATTHAASLDECLRVVADWADKQEEIDSNRFNTLCDQWHHALPDHPQVERLCKRRDELLAVGTAER